MGLQFLYFFGNGGGGEVELFWVVLQARVIEFAHVNSKLTPEGCQPCSTGDSSVK